MADNANEKKELYIDNVILNADRTVTINIDGHRKQVIEVTKPIEIRSADLVDFVNGHSLVLFNSKADKATAAQTYVEHAILREIMGRFEDMIKMLKSTTERMNVSATAVAPYMDLYEKDHNLVNDVDSINATLDELKYDQNQLFFIYQLFNLRKEISKEDNFKLVALVAFNTWVSRDDGTWGMIYNKVGIQFPKKTQANKKVMRHNDFLNFYHGNVFHLRLAPIINKHMVYETCPICKCGWTIENSDDVIPGTNVFYHSQCHAEKRTKELLDLIFAVFTTIVGYKAVPNLYSLDNDIWNGHWIELTYIALDGSKKTITVGRRKRVIEINFSTAYPNGRLVLPPAMSQNTNMDGYVHVWNDEEFYKAYQALMNESFT